MNFNNVSKTHGHEVVVDNLTFTVRPGRVTGSLGANGAGKSAAMKILLDLGKPDHGHATIGGTPYRDMEDPPELRVSSWSPTPSTPAAPAAITCESSLMAQASNRTGSTRCSMPSA